MLTLLFSLRDCFRARAFLQAEILALRHQLLVLQRSNRGHKLRLGWADRVLWVWLSRLWIGDRRCSLSNRRRLSSGIARDFGSIGDGRVSVAKVARRYLRKFGISSG